MNTTAANLRKGDRLASGEVIKSAVRLSLLSSGNSMSKSYAQSHIEVFIEGETHARIWHAGTVLTLAS